MRIDLVFPEGRHKAVTMSYDDGAIADRRLVELFNAHGIKGTFHLNSGLLGSGHCLSAEEAAALYQGHEISAHSVTHPAFRRTPRERLIREIMEDRERLEQLAGYTVRGLSYPFGMYSEALIELLPHLGIDYARVGTSSGRFDLPDDLYRWEPTCHHNEQLMERAEQFVAIDRLYSLYILYVWGHSFEFESDDNWQVMETFCPYIGGYPDIWYATNIEIADYLNAFKRLRFSASCDFVENPGSQSVWLLAGSETVEVGGGQRVRLAAR